MYNDLNCGSGETNDFPAMKMGLVEKFRGRSNGADQPPDSLSGMLSGARPARILNRDITCLLRSSSIVRPIAEICYRN
jgi:hypothetical protein